MGNQDEGKSEALPQFLEQGKNFELSGGIEGGSRLVRNNQRCLADDCLRDQNALALSSAQLMGIRGVNSFDVGLK